MRVRCGELGCERGGRPALWIIGPIPVMAIRVVALVFNCGFVSAPFPSLVLLVYETEVHAAMGTCTTLKLGVKIPGQADRLNLLFDLYGKTKRGRKRADFTRTAKLAIRSIVKESQ